MTTAAGARVLRAPVVPGQPFLRELLRRRHLAPGFKRETAFILRLRYLRVEALRQRLALEALGALLAINAVRDLSRSKLGGVKRSRRCILPVLPESARVSPSGSPTSRSSSASGSGPAPARRTPTEASGRREARDGHQQTKPTTITRIENLRGSANAPKRTPYGIAKELNARGVKTDTGADGRPAAIKRVLRYGDEAAL